jgi:hypothetical protein
MRNAMRALASELALEFTSVPEGAAREGKMAPAASQRVVATFKAASIVASGG